MGQGRVAQGRVGETRRDRDLDGRHDGVGLGGERGEAEDAIALGGDQRLVEAARLGEGPGAEDGGHRDLRETVGDPATLRLRLAQADAGQFGVGEQAGGYQTSGRRPVDSGEIVADHADVVVGHVGELGATRAIAHRPYPGGRRPAPPVDLDEATAVTLDPGGLEPDAVGVRDPTARDEDVRALDPAFHPVALHLQLNGLAGPPLDPLDPSVGADLDPLVLEELAQGLRDVAVLAMRQGVVPIDDRHAAAEAAKGLVQLEPDVAAPQDDEVTRDAVQVEGLDVRHRPRLGEARDRVDPATGAGADHDHLAAEGPRPAVGSHDLDRPRPDEAALSHDQLRAVLPIQLMIPDDHAVDHLPLSVLDGGHLDLPIALDDPELGTPAEEVGDLRAVDQVFAREASDARA